MRHLLAPALALGAGIAIGAWGVPALRAQTAAQGAYVVAETHVTDPAGFMQYLQREPAILAAYHGRILARALPDMREGGPPDGVVTLIAFANPQDANQWYNSPEYASLAALRQKAATSRVYLISGIH
jgi:uncharacterized protein (DUF1330 family)